MIGGSEDLSEDRRIRRWYRERTRSEDLPDDPVAIPRWAWYALVGLATVLVAVDIIQLLVT